MEYKIKQYTIMKMMDKLIGVEEAEIKITIPPFQRDYVWSDNNVDELLLSLKEGFPIGAITLNHITKETKMELMDGLQRYTSIRKIILKPLNYISKELLRYEFKSEGSLISEEDLNTYDSNRKNLIKEKQRKKIEINDVERLVYGMEEYESALRIISNISVWIQDDLLKKKIPHIVLEDFEDDEKNRVFTFINKKGKQLTSFESNASEWSNYLIEMEDDETNNIISNYHNSRTDDYYNILGIDKKSNNNLNDYDNKRILPSNMFQAVFEEAINDFPSFKSVFYTGKNLRSSAIESMVEIVKYSLKDLSSDDEKADLLEVGKILQKYIHNSNDIDLIIDTIKGAFLKLKQQATILSALKSNKENIYMLKLSSWMISTFVVTLLKYGLDKTTYFNEWIIYETVAADNYGKGTNTYAKKIIKNGSYKNSPKDLKIDDVKMEQWFLNKFMNEEHSTREDNKISKFAETTIGLIQNKYIPSDATSLHIDHLIPQNTIDMFEDINGNSISNLSLLTTTENTTKNSFLEMDTLEKYDFIYNNVEFKNGQKKAYKDQFELIRKKSYSYQIDSNGNTIKTKTKKGKKHPKDTVRESKPIIDFLNLRKKYLKQIALEQLFKQDN